MAPHGFLESNVQCINILTILLKHHMGLLASLACFLFRLARRREVLMCH